MVESVAHRGPDGAGTWSEGPVGLGHRMLHTTPESLNEEFPLTSKTGDLVVTADARIDNRDELIAVLGLTGRPREEITDAELILGAYRRWDERCPEMLLGDFAFAIWDRPNQTLFCARDHFGVKQLYFYSSNRIFVFASEIKALLCLPQVPRGLNEARLADYLMLISEDKSATLYQDIFRLPPGHTLTASRKVTRTRSYWALDPTREVRFRSDAEYAETFRDIFTEAVRCRLRSVRSVGSMLSGGLDSSSITCAARDLMGRNGAKRLHTFSGVYDDVPECDERPYINAVLAHGGVEPHFVHPERLSPLSDWESTLLREDEPLWNPQMAVHWLAYRAAQDENVRVLLDGFGGDFVVSHGTAYLAELARAGRWITLVSEAAGLGKHLDRPLWKIVWRGGLAPLAPQSVRQARRRLWRRNGVMETYNAPIRPDFAQRISLAERVASLQGERHRPARSSREEHWLELTSGLAPSWSLAVLDRTAALFRIEPRFPFFDRRLAEYCLALPPEQKMRQGWTRMIMRRALINVLPEEIRWRGGKADLSPSFNHGLWTIDRGVLDDVLLRNPGCITEYVDIADVRQIYQRYLSDKDGNDGFTLWQIATIALWLRQTGLSSPKG
jgi:asparagine synthase (glutamine-hydrolysing)